MPDISTSLTSGVAAKGYREGGTSADPWTEYVILKEDRIVSYRGRAQSFRIPGLAGTTGQRLASISNDTGSTTRVGIDKITVDVYQTAAKVVAPPVIRLYRVYAPTTGGATMPKVPLDTTLVSNASVIARQGAAADGSGLPLTATLAAGDILSQEPAPRALTLVGVDQFDRAAFLDDGGILLRAGDGLVVNLDYTVATSNPVTDMWFVGIQWTEFTRP